MRERRGSSCLATTAHTYCQPAYFTHSSHTAPLHPTSHRHHWYKLEGDTKLSSLPLQVGHTFNSQMWTTQWESHVATLTGCTLCTVHMYMYVEQLGLTTGLPGTWSVSILTTCREEEGRGRERKGGEGRGRERKGGEGRGRERKGGEGRGREERESRGKSR